MRRVFSFYSTTIGKKVVMAVTGIILVGFVIGHMLGNLKLYLGAESLNAYGAFLREFGYPLFPHEAFLWFVRIVLLVSVFLHIKSAWDLTQLSHAARPDDYRQLVRQDSTYAAHAMRWGGVFLVVFIVYHILHFTTGQLHPHFEHGEVYANVVTGFSVWWAAVIYLLAMIPLGLHLYHGVWSMMQTLGINHPRYNHLRRGVAMVIAWLVVLGNISFPIAVLAGVVK
jgi:succinate dehydrogenase / fumarate reductase cytochrome b subunit